MYYHLEKRLLYLAHPRTASMSTASALCNGSGFEKAVPGDHHSPLWENGTARPFSKEERGAWIVFTTVRNHWDAAVSWRYKKRYLREHTGLWDGGMWRLLFEANHWIKPGNMWWLHSDEADVVLRFESLERELGELLANHGIPFDGLPEDNITPGRTTREYRPFFSEHGRDYIGERFRNEIEKFSYTF